MRYRIFLNGFRLKTTSQAHKPKIQIYDTETETLSEAHQVSFPSGGRLVVDLDGFTVRNVDHFEFPRLPKTARFVAWVECDSYEEE